MDNITWRRVSGLLISSLCILCCISMKFALPIPCKLGNTLLSIFLQWNCMQLIARENKQVKLIYAFTVRVGVCKVKGYPLIHQSFLFVQWLLHLYNNPIFGTNTHVNLNSSCTFEILKRWDSSTYLDFPCQVFRQSHQGQTETVPDQEQERHCYRWW